MLYSAQAGGFFDRGVHGTNIPPDAVEITAAEHAELLAGQSAGKTIAAGQDGRPALADRPVRTPEEALASERAAMVVSRFQARVALHNAGLLQSVEAAVAAADPFVQIAWADAVEFRRNSQTIVALAAALSLPDTQVDDLFRAAKLIEA